MSDAFAGSSEALAHEATHAMDYRAAPIRFILGYLFPQVMVVFALFALFGLLWWPLWFLGLFLICAAPFPAPFRKAIELRGYKANLAVNVWTHYHSNYEWCMEYFTGPTYYYMGASGVKEEFEAFLKKIKNEEALGLPYDAFKVVLMEPKP
jgi:hypothetical protein